MLANPKFLVPTVLAVMLAGPAVHAQDELTGMFRITRQTTDVVGPQFAEALKEIIRADEQLQWQVYVPENYDAARPAGLFIYHDPEGHGYMPEEWQPVFAKRNMIWLGVKRTQRKLSVTRVSWVAIVGSRALVKDYAIDVRRMYVGGTGHFVPVALNTMLVANEFSGGVYIRGSYYPESRAWEPDELQAMQRKRHVFITGTNDDNKTRIRNDYEEYREDGIEDVELIFDMQLLGSMPSPDQIDAALAFLDSRLQP